MSSIASSPSAADPPAHEPRVRGPALWLAIGGGLVALFFVRLTYYVFLDVAGGATGTLPDRTFEEVTGALTAIPVIGAALWLARRNPVVRGRVSRSIAMLLAGFVVLSAIHTVAMVEVRALLGPAFGFDFYGFGLHPSRFAYEMANDVLPFAIFFVGYALAESLLARRERERRAAELERTLLQSELRSLRLQLQPHFLFNALNTVAEAIYDDPGRADALLGNLAELLRTSLRTTHTHEVPVRDEIVLLESYLALMRARFGDRLQVSLRVAPEVQGALVPSMILQPLVENAVRHGGVAEAGRGRVTVTIAPGGADRLEIRVHDDGPGARGRTLEVDGEGGTGLSATARRLELLYGPAHELQAGDAPDGGFAVRIVVPLRVVNPSGTEVVAGARWAAAASGPEPVPPALSRSARS